MSPVTGGLAYYVHEAVQGSMPFLSMLVVTECLVAAAWLAMMRYSAKVRGPAPPCPDAGVVDSPAFGAAKAAGNSAPAVHVGDAVYDSDAALHVWSLGVAGGVVGVGSSSRRCAARFLLLLLLKNG